VADVQARRGGIEAAVQPERALGEARPQRVLVRALLYEPAGVKFVEDAQRPAK